MIIGVDAGCLGIKDIRLKVGVYFLARSLFEKIGKIDKENTYLLYSFYPIGKNLLKPFGPNFRNIVVKPSRGWMKVWLPLRLLKDKPNIFLGLNNSLPLKLPMQNYKTIVIIHDLLFERYPGIYPGSYRKLHKESKEASEKADRIIAPSEATKKDIEDFYRIQEEKIIVAYEGVREFKRINNKGLKINSISKILNTNYFLYVGALKPQKNVPMLIRAFARIKVLPAGRQGKGLRINLIIVGGDKWRDPEIDRTVDSLSPKIRSHIHFLGVVDDGELSSLYKNALAFVSPSLSEGFGLTFLEAMSFGTPVIGPNDGSVPEVIGNAGILVDPKNVSEVAKAMKMMLNDNYRIKLRMNTKIQVRKFTWKKFARTVLDSIGSLGYNLL